MLVLAWCPKLWGMTGCAKKEQLWGAGGGSQKNGSLYRTLEPTSCVTLGKAFYLQGLSFFAQNRTKLDQRECGPFLNFLTMLTSSSCFPSGGHTR